MWVVRTCTSVSDLLGIGEEWLVDEDREIRLRFYDGNIVTSIVNNISELETLVPLTEEKRIAA